MMTWYDTAEYCEETFGCFVDWDEGFFICPECNDCVYEVDWEDHDNWNICPICEVDFRSID